MKYLNISSHKLLQILCICMYYVSVNMLNKFEVYIWQPRNMCQPWNDYLLNQLTLKYSGRRPSTKDHTDINTSLATMNVSNTTIIWRQRKKYILKVNVSINIHQIFQSQLSSNSWYSNFALVFADSLQFPITRIQRREHILSRSRYLWNSVIFIARKVI